MALNLFIDTNVLLNFYHFSGEDLEELKKLIALVEQKQVDLWVPEQVRDEFDRNRDVKIRDAMTNMTKDFKLTAPAFFKNFPDFSGIHDGSKDLSKKLSALMAVVQKEVADKNLAADHTISGLFDKGKDIPRDAAICDLAMSRYRVGNPPGKKKETIGDEINWESLLRSVPAGCDLHIVSIDGDYGTPGEEGRPNSFLEKEYEKKKGAKLYLYKSLAAFFKVHFPKIKLATDIAKMAAINKLSASGTFASTHTAIASLEKYKSDLNRDDIEMLTEIAESNQQVNWIIEDPDVASFYKDIAASGEVGQALRVRIMDLFPKPEEEEEEEDEEGILF